MYKLTKDEYNKLLNESITATYKKVNNDIDKRINLDGKAIITDSIIKDRMFKNGQDNSFITLKDHKANFENNPKVRLINPAKNEIGRISKAILDKINKNLKNIMKVNQWKDSSEVITWFKQIDDKSKHKFIIFDIKDFYPSISKSLLQKALEFAKSKVTIEPEEENIISHSRKLLLYNNNQAWVKKGTEFFDVTMGAYDGAEICELIGVFMLNKLQTKYDKKNFGLYRGRWFRDFKKHIPLSFRENKKRYKSIFQRTRT